MSNQRLWYMDPRYLSVIVAIVAIAVTIIVWRLPYQPPAPDFSISINPMQGAVQQGGVISTAITVKGEDGYKESVSLSASGQPSGVIVTFVPPIGGPKPSYTSSVTITVDSNVQVDDHTITIKGIGADGKEHSCSYILSVRPQVTPTPTPPPTPTSATLTPSPWVTLLLPLSVSEVYNSSGWIGDWGDITFDALNTDNPHSGPTCIKIDYSAARSQGAGWAGIYWQYPDNNWGDKPEGRDLTGATKLTFWAKGKKGGEKAEFKIGGITGKYPDSLLPAASTGVITLSDNWQQYTVDLTARDLSHIIGGFCWVTDKTLNPYGCTIYLDDIRYE